MLFRKMVRDIWLNRGTYIASATIIALGLIIFNVFSIGYDNFRISQDAYYEEYRFGDGFAEVEGISSSDLNKLSRIPGIRKIEGQLVKDVKLSGTKEDKNVYIRLISYDPQVIAPLNDFRVLRGVKPNGNNQIVMGNKFFSENALELEDTLKVICGGKLSTLTIKGVGQSPEYIYALRTDQDLYPDAKTFGIAFVPIETLERLNSSRGQVNQISFQMDGSVEYKFIEAQLKSALKEYGLKTIYARKDQKSNLVLNQELNGMQTMAKILPILFLTVAAMIMYIMLKRLIETQRQQIGVLKAFGYKDRQILMHYISYAVMIACVGGIIGSLIGNVLVIPFTEMYQKMFNMPLQKASFSLLYFVKGMAIVTVFSVFAGIQGAKATLKLEPSEAMRASVPKFGKAETLLKFDFIIKKVNLIGRLALRSIVRSKGRSIFIILGMTFTIALLGMAWSFKDMLNAMIVDQFDKVQIYDMKIAFTKPVDEALALREISKYHDIKQIESLAEVPVKLKHMGLSKEVILIGLDENSQLYQLYDDYGNPVYCKENGLILSERLSEILDVKVGETLYLNSLYMKDVSEDKPVKVVAIIPQYLGLNAYMNLKVIPTILDQAPFSTSILLNGKESVLKAIKEDYRNSEMVFGMDEKKDILDRYDEMMQMFMSMMGMLCLFGVITGFAVIYASTIISISERKRELASMLVIGMNYKEVLSVVKTEQWILSVMSIILGIPLMKIMVVGMAVEMNNDVYTMPTTLSFETIIVALILTGLSIFIAQLTIKKKIDEINLIEALSMKE